MLLHNSNVDEVLNVETYKDSDGRVTRMGFFDWEVTVDPLVKKFREENAMSVTSSIILKTGMTPGFKVLNKVKNMVHCAKLEAAEAASSKLVTIGKADEGDEETVLSMVATQRKGQQEVERVAAEERACDKEAAQMKEQQEEAGGIADQGACDEEATESEIRRVESRSALWLALIAVMAFLSIKDIINSNRLFFLHLTCAVDVLLLISC